jgi:hypothetical protein
VIKDIWAERFWTVIVVKDAATRGATEGLSFLGDHVGSRRLVRPPRQSLGQRSSACRRRQTAVAAETAATAVKLIHRNRLMMDEWKAFDLRG